MTNIIIDIIEEIDSNCCGKECEGHLIRHALKQLSEHYISKFPNGDAAGFMENALQELIRIAFLMSDHDNLANAMLMHIILRENLAQVPPCEDCEEDTHT